MYCKECGSKNPENVAFCSNCGAKLREEKVAAKNAPEGVSEECRPISAWGYVGYQFLFSLPCVGIICLFIFAFGGTKNINLKNFARSYLLIFLIVIVITLILTLIFGLTGTLVSILDQ